MGLLDRGTEMSGKQISEEEQQTLDIFVANGIKLIHDEKVTDTLLARIEGSQDKIEGVAFALLDLLGRVEGSAIASKIKLTSIVIVHGMNYLLAELINLAEKAGVIPSLNEEQRKQAFAIAVSKYIDNAVKSGKITPEQLQQMSQQFQATPEGKKIAERLSQQGMNATPPVEQPAIPSQSPPAIENGGQPI
jgi:predicted transcriptional regulator